MHAPPQGNLQQREIVLLGHRLNQPQGIEGGVFEISLPIQEARLRGVAVTAFRWDLGALVLPGEYTASERVVDDDVDAIAVARRDDLLFERSR